jgi:uncharacterized membrane protein
MVQIFFGMLLLAVYNIFFLIFSLLLILMVILIFYFTSPKGMETNLKVSTKNMKPHIGWKKLEGLWPPLNLRVIPNFLFIK